MNHESCVKLCKDEFQEFSSETTESVFVHDHNLFDHSFDDGVQKGLKTLAFEVDSAGNVCIDFMLGVTPLKVCDLSVEVFALMPGGNSCVDGTCTPILARFTRPSEHLCDICSFVQSFSIIPKTDCVDYSFVPPVS